MNLAFYIDSLSNSIENKEIYDCLNNAVKNENINDCSLFFNNVGKVDTKFNFGSFNSTDIWNYTGILIATTLDNVLFCSKIVNKFKIIYLYSGHDNIFKLLDIINNCKTITMKQEYVNEIYRVSGKKIKNIEQLNIDSILKAIEE